VSEFSRDLVYAIFICLRGYYVLYLPQHGAQPLAPAPSSNRAEAGDLVSAQDLTRLQDINPPLDVAFVQT
jgi:hypothetical protein